MQETLRCVSANVLTHRLLEIVQLPLVSEKLELKAIYIQASDDMLVPKHCYEVFDKYISDIKLYKVEGSHLLLQSSALECAKIVEKFVVEDMQF